MTSPTCSMDGCARAHYARTWCELHYQRWRRTGDPLGARGRRRPRSDAWTHGSRTGYHYGCRCYPCGFAASEYSVAWTAGETARTPASVVIRHVKQLLASGWTLAALTRETNLAASTMTRVMSGQRSVNSRTVAALLAVEPLTRRVSLAAAPLLDRIQARHRGHLATVMTPADRRIHYRAQAQGRISDALADRLAVRYLGYGLELVYGPDWHLAGAA